MCGCEWGLMGLGHISICISSLKCNKYDYFLKDDTELSYIGSVSILGATTVIC